jgi:NADH-quinone oxidoreductase subunit A
MEQNTFNSYLPIVIQFVVAAGFVVTTLIVTHLLGPRRRKSDTKLDTFECGIESHGNARLPFSVKYFLVAILFVLFDVEIIFMYPWAVNFRELAAIDGVQVFVSMLIFLGFLLTGFLYIIKKGALKWE